MQNEPWVVGAVVVWALLACHPERKQEPAAEASAPVETRPAASASALPSASSPIASASAVPAPPSLASRFAGAPQGLGKTKVPIRDGGRFSGAVASAPLGWSGAEWDPEGVAGPAYSGDVYGGALMFSSPDNYAALYYTATRAQPDAPPRPLSAIQLLQAAYPAGIGKSTWGEAIPAKVGETEAPALIYEGTGVGVAKGSGKPWRAYVVSLVIAGKQVIVAAAWDESHPEHEAALIEGIKGIRG